MRTLTSDEVVVIVALWLLGVVLLGVGVLAVAHDVVPAGLVFFAVAALAFAGGASSMI